MEDGAGVDGVGRVQAFAGHQVGDLAGGSGPFVLGHGFGNFGGTGAAEVADVGAQLVVIGVGLAAAAFDAVARENGAIGGVGLAVFVAVEDGVAFFVLQNSGNAPDVYHGAEHLNV